MDDSLSIILPVLNEERSIENVIRNIFDLIPGYIEEFEVIVVDAGSTDNTTRIIEGLKLSGLDLKSLSHERNMGFGTAVSSGIKLSEKKWIFIMDSDGQFQMDDFSALWAKRHSYDFILGFRKKRKDNLYRLLLGRLGNLIACLLLKKRVIDINCGFKLFNGEELRSLSLCSSGGLINLEIVYKLFENKKSRFLQFPISHYQRKYGRETGGGFKTVLRILFEGKKLFIK
jgi:glycosyltransferase involved in cell wall biosynthesis